MKRYEIMFLFDNAVVHEWSDMEAEAKRLFDRIGATPLVIVKFDERKLAYEINGRKRGTYVLSYFDAEPGKITELERDVKLSEVLLRAMVLKADNLTEEKLEELKAHKPDQPLQPFSSEGRRGEGGRGRYDSDDSDQRSDDDDSSSNDKPSAKKEEKPESAVATAESPSDGEESNGDDDK